MLIGDEEIIIISVLVLVMQAMLNFISFHFRQSVTTTIGAKKENYNKKQEKTPSSSQKDNNSFP